MSAVPQPRAASRPLSVDDAIREIRSRPEGPELLRQLYLDDDPAIAAARFAASGEWTEVLALLGDLAGLTVVDVGAGGGMASAAFADSGAAVIAVEPDASAEVGTGRLRAVAADRSITIVEAAGEGLPLRDASVDVVYCRQVLHHARDLDRLVGECARVLRPDGRFIACREHVVRDGKDLEAFLLEHPVHQLAGGEHAFTLAAYTHAVAAAGLRLDRSLGPWDSVVNAFPTVTTGAELRRVERVVLRARFGTVGAAAATVPGVGHALRSWITRPKPGELHTFLAVKP